MMFQNHLLLARVHTMHRLGHGSEQDTLGSCCGLKIRLQNQAREDPGLKILIL